MFFPTKYGVARHIYIPVIKRAVVDFAVGADWTPAAGDVRISKDGGASANVTNLPTAITMNRTAYWDFLLTATELQAAQVVVTVCCAATKPVEDQAFILETYGNASAQHAVDFADIVRAGLTALPNAAAAANGGLPTVDATNSVKVQTPVKKNTALSNFEFLLTDSTNHNPKTSAASIVPTRSIDGGAFAAGGLSAVTEVAFGIYRVDFAASDLNGNVITLRVTATACDDTVERLITFP
jgi:hypothetical protein